LIASVGPLLAWSTPITPEDVDPLGFGRRHVRVCGRLPHSRGFSLGAVIDAPMRDGVEVLNTADGWYPAIDSSGATRESASVVEATKLVYLSKWPTGTRLALYAVSRTGDYFTRKGQISRAYAEDDATPECP
jgi:hypothetical protein